MTPDNLLRALEQLGEEVNLATEGRTNWGGCGVYAYCVHKRLHAIGVPSVPVLLSYGNFLRDLRLSCGRTYHAIRSGDASPAHVVLRIRVAGQAWWHDSENTTTTLPEGWQQWTKAGAVPRRELAVLTRSSIGWNPEGYHPTCAAEVGRLAVKHLPTKWRGKIAA